MEFKASPFYLVHLCSLDNHGTQLARAAVFQELRYADYAMAGVDELQPQLLAVLLHSTWRDGGFHVSAVANSSSLRVSCALCSIHRRAPAVRRFLQRVEATRYAVSLPIPDSVSGLQARIAERKRQGGKTGWLEARLDWYQQRAYPNDRIDWSKYPLGIARRDKMAPARIGRAARGGVEVYPAGFWQFMGPRNLEGSNPVWNGPGNLAGRVNGLAYSPNAGTYFAASAGGGIWKTVNSGGRWFNANTDNWPQIRTSAVAVHPTDPNIVYVGTGDYNWGTNSYGSGIWKSINGGGSWTMLIASGGASIRSVVIDPENPDTVLLTTGRSPDYQGEVYRSTDAGAHWSLVSPEGANYCDLAWGADNSGARYLYAVGEADGGRMYRSADRGATWTELRPPLLPLFQSALDIATSPTQPNTVYLLSGTDRRIYKSTDAGNNWDDITSGFPNDFNPGDRANWRQAAYDRHISCSTRNDIGEDVIYVGLIDLAASTDGGNSWRRVGWGHTVNATMHVDHHAFAVNPENPNESLVGSDGGVYRLTFNPQADSFAVENLNNGLEVTQFYRSAHHPSSPDHAIGGTQDLGNAALLGTPENWINAGGGDGAMPAINPVDPTIQYSQSQNLTLLYRTESGWLTRPNEITPNWGTDRLPFIGSLVVNPGTPKYLYAGTNFLWRWDEDTDTWTPRLGGVELAVDGGTISYIAVAPTDTNRLYVATSTGLLWTSGDGGANWARIERGKSSLPQRFITSIDVNPSNPVDIVVTVSGTGTGHVWRLTNVLAGNRVCVDKSANLLDLPANTVAIDPDDPDNLLYVGLDIGVFATRDGGRTWQNATAPLRLPNVQINDLHVVPGTGFLNAATYGRGMWRISVDPPKYSINGRITRNGQGLEGVTVAAGNAGIIGSAATNVGGYYSIPDLAEGIYNITPSLAGFAFDPESRAVDLRGSDLFAVDFSAAPATYRISGRITRSGAGLAGVTVSAGSASALTNANGDYLLGGLAPGRVTPLRIGASFAPPSQRVTINTSNITGVTFVANVTPPAAPTKLVATARKNRKIRLRWKDNSDDELGFRIESRMRASDPFTTLLEVGYSDTLEITTRNRVGKTYEFRVLAFNKHGNSNYSNIASATARR